ncbi:MAG: antibiotic biosynthesis monooxygenase family protein [Desulfobulbia bacterium]
MAIGVLVRRITKDGVNAKILLPDIVEIRSLSVRQPGYISGETIFNLDRPEECIVISKWTTKKHWQEWEKHPKRLDLIKKMEKHLGAKTQYNVYGIGLW